MDMSRLSRGQMIAGGGAIVLIVSLFLSWESGFGISATAFDLFSGMDIIMLIVGIAVLAYVGSTAMGSSVALPGNSAMIVALLGVAMVGWTLGWCLEDPIAGIGAWLALASSIAITYGGYEATRVHAPVVRSAAAEPTGPVGTAESSSPPSAG